MRELVIIGAGPVGLTLALGMEQLGIKCVVVDNKQPPPDTGKISIESPPSHFKPFALSASSCQLFKNLNMWAQLKSNSEPITDIHVSSQGGFGRVHMQAQSFHRKSFGRVIAADVLQRALESGTKNAPNIRFLRPANLESIDVSGRKEQLVSPPRDNVAVRIAAGAHTIELKTPLLIGADGVHSKVRELCQIKAQIHNYESDALTTVVRLKKADSGLAVERFTDEGPIALLPLKGGLHGLIRVAPSSWCDRFIALTVEQQSHLLAQLFGGRFAPLMIVQKINRFPVVSVKAGNIADNRIVILGSAANHLHPVAGQGLNLAMRDIATLLEVLKWAKDTHNDFGAQNILKSYSAQRHDQHRLINFGTHCLSQMYLSKNSSFKRLALLGLFGIERSQLLQAQLVQVAMGLSGKLPPMMYPQLPVITNEQI